MKEKIIPNFVPFPQCPYTDAPYVLWLFLHHYLMQQKRRHRFTRGLQRDYAVGLHLMHQACMAVEAMTTEDILHHQPGRDAGEFLARGEFIDFDGNLQRYYKYYRRATAQLLRICRLLGIPMTLRCVRSQQWLFVADYAKNAGITGSAFLRYVQKHGEGAIERLVLQVSAERYCTTMRETDGNTYVT